MSQNFAGVFWFIRKVYKSQDKGLRFNFICKPHHTLVPVDKQGITSFLSKHYQIQNSYSIW